MDFGAQFFHRPGKGRIDLAPGLGKNFLHLLEQRHGDVFKQTAGLGAVAAFHGGFEPYGGIMQGQMDGPELLKKRLQRGQFPLQPRFAGTVEPAAEYALMPVQRGVQGGLAVVEQIRLHAGRPLQMGHFSGQEHGVLPGAAQDVGLAPDQPQFPNIEQHEGQDNEHAQQKNGDQFLFYGNVAQTHDALPCFPVAPPSAH